MNVIDNDLVVVRGINSDWFVENFKDFRILFGGSPQAIPKQDSHYVGLYVEAPVSKISHIGIVEDIRRDKYGATFILKSIIKLPNPVDPGHAIRKHENWTLSELGIVKSTIEEIRDNILAFS